jgi:hypothetical protein
VISTIQAKHIQQALRGAHPHCRLRVVSPTYHTFAPRRGWARELTKLGHRVRLMPAKDVKAYVKRNKNDAADAEAICEAVRRAFVPVKSAEQQSRLMLHRTRVGRKEISCASLPNRRHPMA